LVGVATFGAACTPNGEMLTDGINTALICNAGTWSLLNSVASANTIVGTLGVAKGGTGQSSNWTQYGLLYAQTPTITGQVGLGTTTTLLHGNAGGAPTWGNVASADFGSNVLAIANGGTNGTATPTAGGVAYGTGAAVAYSANTARTDYALHGGNGGAPTWANSPTLLMQSSDVNANGTTPVALTGITFNMVSGNTYKIECTIALTNASTTLGGRIAVTSPAVTAATYTVGTMATSATVTLWTNATAAGTWPAACTTGCIAQRYIWKLDAVVVPSASSAWSLSGVGSGAGTGLLVSKGSSCTYWML
jgi:hypothetical protein